MDGPRPRALSPAPRRRLAAAVGLLLVIPACRAGAPAAARGAGAAPHGDPFLSIVLEDPHGRSIRLAEFAGKVRVLDVWATWCAPCREVIPQLNALQERYRDQGLVVVGVSVDDGPAEVLEFARAIPIRYPCGMFNPDVAALLGEPGAIPTTYLIDRAGTVRETFVGFVDAATLDRRVRGLLQGPAGGPSSPVPGP